MSVVVCLKYNKGVVMGCDTQISYGKHRFDNCLKINKSRFSNTAIGITGSLRLLNILRNELEDLMDYRDILLGRELDISYIIKFTIKKIIRILRDNQYLIEKDDIIQMDGEIIISTEKSIYIVANDFSVLECKNYGVVGCGDSLTMGYLNNVEIEPQNLTEEQAINLVTNSITTSCKDDIYINNEVKTIIIKEEQ